MSFKKIDKLLRQNGWVLVRVKGSHFQYKKCGFNYLAVVPNHGSKDISIGVLRSLEKGTGLSLFMR